MNLFEIQQAYEIKLLEDNQFGFRTTDLVAILRAQSGPWREYIYEAKKEFKKKPATPPSSAQVEPSKPRIVFRTCPLFDETMTKRGQSNPIVASKVNDFMKIKGEDPRAQFSKVDKYFASHGKYPTLIHAHITHDLSLVYTRSGIDPIVFDLYGVFTHDDLGTGHPTAMKKQIAMSSRFARQEFK